MSGVYRELHAEARDEGEVVVAVRDLVVAYDEDIALRVASLDVRAGVVHGLVGPNGAGKSTLLRAMAGLHAPERGTVVIHGVDLYEAPPHAWPRIGFMPDNTPVYERLTVAEWLAMWVRETPARVTVESALERVGLGGLGEHRAGTLSLGMRQRLGLARLLLLEAPLLLLDEPANGMDPAARQMLADVLRAEAASGAAVVVSSHILHELDVMCDRFVIIDRGRVTAEGTTDELSRGDHKSAAVQIELDGVTPAITEALRAALAEVDGATLDRFEGEIAHVRMGFGRPSRAALVRALVARGVPVCGVWEARVGLPSVYAELTRKETR
jgi:ABC-2 type transport system ATP-binding protein